MWHQECWIEIGKGPAHLLLELPQLKSSIQRRIHCTVCYKIWSGWTIIKGLLEMDTQLVKGVVHMSWVL